MGAGRLLADLGCDIRNGITREAFREGSEGSEGSGQPRVGGDGPACEPAPALEGGYARPPVSDGPLRLGIIGLGRMGRFHAAALAGVEEVEVVALAEPSPDALEQAGTLLPGRMGYRARSRRWPIPASRRCWSPRRPRSHPELVGAALEAGAARAVREAPGPRPGRGSPPRRSCRRPGRVLQVGFWRRFAPPWRVAKERIDAGDIGTPVYVRLAQWDADPPPATFCDPAVSGGLAIDCGVHEYDLAEWLTGRRMPRVSAWPLPVVEPAVGAAGDLDNLIAVLELEGGAVATVDLSRNARYGDDVRTEVLGSNGALLVDLLPTSRTRLGRRRRRARAARVGGGGRDGRRRGRAGRRVRGAIAGRGCRRAHWPTAACGRRGSATPSSRPGPPGGRRAAPEEC